MSIRTIHELPSELPHAHLYLDDIEKISKILLKAYAPCFREREKEAKIVYTVGDPRMDSIGDLETHGGTPRTFPSESTGLPELLSEVVLTPRSTSTPWTSSNAGHCTPRSNQYLTVAS